MADIWMDVDTALSEVPVNVFPLTDDTDFKTRETSVAYDAAGMDLVWNFVTTAGAFTQTAVTPTTGGSYDWTHQGDGMYTIEIPASGGASINNDTEGFGWFSGVATGVLPWRGPIIGFRASGINNKLIDDAYSTERGLAGTALPAAAADAAGGLPISDAGGLDVDTILGRITEARMGALTDWINGGRLDLILDAIAGDVVNLDGAAMRGTDGAALASAWTATRAGYIDLLNTYLDAAVSSRLATAGYTAPDNTNIGNIITAINHATYGLNALLTAINTRLATASYTAPDNASITAILEDTATTIPALIAALNNLSSAQAQAAAAAALTAYDPPTKSELDSAVSPLATAAAVAAMRGADDDTLKTLSDQIDGISGGGGDATAANQATIIGHLEDMKGATFSETTDSLEAIRNRGDVAWLTGGGASGSNAVEITVTDGEDVPIQEVKVEIWNSDESVLVTYGTTDAEGVVNLTANDGTYRVRMIKGGWSFTTQNLTVDGAESVTYTGESRSVPGPASPDVCRLYEYLFLPDGSPPSTLAARAATLRIYTLPFDDDAAVYSGAAIDGTYDADTGLVYWDVVQGAVVRVTIGVFGVDLILTVPSESTARISNIE